MGMRRPKAAGRVTPANVSGGETPFPVRGVSGGWRDVWDDPNDHAQLRAEAGYASAGGQAIDLPRVRFWQMLGSLRWGVMCLTMYLSWRDGVVKSVERPMIGRRVSETEADLVVLLEEGL